MGTEAGSDFGYVLVISSGGLCHQCHGKPVASVGVLEFLAIFGHLLWVLRRGQAANRWNPQSRVRPQWPQLFPLLRTLLVALAPAQSLDCCGFKGTRVLGADYPSTLGVVAINATPTNAEWIQCARNGLSGPSNGPP
jgi:hypothetical protein